MTGRHAEHDSSDTKYPKLIQLIKTESRMVDLGSEGRGKRDFSIGIISISQDSQILESVNTI